MHVDRLPSVIVIDRGLALTNAVKIVFPTATTLLCRYHILSNILAHCRNLFEHKEKWVAFNSASARSVIVFSSSDDEYLRNVCSLSADYHTYPKAVEYVRKEWLEPYRDRFVAAWTDKIKYYGNVNTNRAESSHAKLKRHLGTSQGDFEKCWGEIHGIIEMQHTNIKDTLEKSVFVVEYNFNTMLFKELWGLVSKNPLDIIFEEAKRANQVGIYKFSCGCINRTANRP